ncbi:MAG: DUF6036 family nucleotidyltransferase [Gemmatales bacterium]
MLKPLSIKYIKVNWITAPACWFVTASMLSDRRWGEHRLNQWLSHSPVQQQLNSILKDTFDRIGFPTLEKRVMEFTTQQDIEAMFRAIGSHVRSPLKMAIGGSTALILPGLLARQTEDVDVVDEVPKSLRDDHAFMHSLKEKFGLVLAHFQSHYLPTHWENRTHWHGEYGELTVVLVDPIDVFLSKLFSIRSKDYTDMKVLIQQLDRTLILDRLKRNCQSLLTDESLKERATNNWYILTGDRLEL